MLIKFLLNGKEIDLTGDNVIIKSNNFNVDKDGNMNCNNAQFNSASINNGNFNVDAKGNMSCKNATITGGRIDIDTSRSLGDRIIRVTDNLGATTFIGTVNALIGATDINDINTGVYLQGCSGGESMVRANTISQTSLESQKKNFEKLENGLDIVCNTEIYKYNLKTQDDKAKKHIGFVIGEKYNYSKELTNSDNNGVDLYSMVSVAYKAIQEQQKQIEKLELRLEGK